MPEKRKFKPSDYAQYSNLVFQLFAWLIIAYFLGKWLDRTMENEQPIMTTITMFVAIIVYLYYIVKQTSKHK